MGLSSLLYQSAKNRFSNQMVQKNIFKPVAKSVNSDGTQMVTYSGYNPNTDRHIYNNVMGEKVEAEMGGGKGFTAQPTGGSGIVHQGVIVG